MDPAILWLVLVSGPRVIFCRTIAPDQHPLRSTPGSSLDRTITLAQHTWHLIDGYSASVAAINATSAASAAAAQAQPPCYLGTQYKVYDSVPKYNHVLLKKSESFYLSWQIGLCPTHNSAPEKHPFTNRAQFQITNQPTKAFYQLLECFVCSVRVRTTP